MPCPGSVEACEALEPDNTDSPASALGTAVHELIEHCLENDASPEEYRGKRFNGVTIGSNEIAGAEVCCDYVQSVLDMCEGDDPELELELEVDIPLIDGRGHIDITIFDKATRTLHIIDYKNGGLYVPVEENRQLTLYAIGARDLYKSRLPRGKGWGDTYIHIVQPNCFEAGAEKCRCWLASKRYLSSFKTECSSVVELIKAGDAPLHAGEKQCRWCDFGGECPERAKMAIEAAHADFEEFINEEGAGVPDKTSVPGLTAEQIVNCYFNLKFIATWAKGIEAEVIKRLSSSEGLPGMKLVEGRSSRRWRDEDEVMTNLQLYGVKPDAYAPRKLLGLGAVEKLFPKADRKALMEELTEKPRGAPQAARESDPRPPYDGDATEDFAEDIDDG